MDIQSASCLSHTKGVFTFLHAVDDDVGHDHPSMVAFDYLLSGKKNHHSDGIVERYFIELNECVQESIDNIESVFTGDTKVLVLRLMVRQDAAKSIKRLSGDVIVIPAYEA